MHPYMRKGEWLELRMEKGLLANDSWKEQLDRVHPFPPGLMRRLEQQKGVQISGDRLRLRLFPDEVPEENPQWLELEVLYEDDFCAVVYKSPGMPVHASTPGQAGTLGNALAAYYESAGQACRLRHIHRLDEDTTGPVLYAKNEYAHLILDAAMREKNIRRIYTAITQGHLNPPDGLIDQPIGRDRHHPKRRRVSSGGDPARTYYATLERAEYASLVELRLDTGRTHQIRVHMQHAGTPLVGDDLYGGSLSLFNRQALHGSRLDFIHPWTGEEVSVPVEPPADFLSLWSRLQEGAKP